MGRGIGAAQAADGLYTALVEHRKRIIGCSFVNMAKGTAETLGGEGIGDRRFRHFRVRRERPFCTGEAGDCGWPITTASKLSFDAAISEGGVRAALWSPEGDRLYLFELSRRTHALSCTRLTRVRARFE